MSGPRIAADTIGGKPTEAVRARSICYRVWYQFVVGKLRRGNFIFVTWKGDHGPRHVHVYSDRKWNLDDRVPMKGHATARVLQLIAELEKEGSL